MESLRECERTGAFGAPFVALARQVHLTNDRRAALKRGIDLLVGSDVREYKSDALPSRPAAVPPWPAPVPLVQRLRWWAACRGPGRCVRNLPTQLRTQRA